MPIGERFGRRLRIRVGSQIVVDYDPGATTETNEGRNLDASFITTAHTLPEPMTTEVTVFGLNERVRKLMDSQQQAAQKQAWQRYQAVIVTGETQVEEGQEQDVAQSLVFQGGLVTIEAGYRDDFALIAKAQILPTDGIKHSWEGGGWVTTIRAQDNRLPWSNAWVSEPIGGADGVTMVDLNRALRVSEQFLTGDIGASEVEAAVPGLLERKRFPGYENGKVLFGNTNEQNRSVTDTLGLRAFFDRGELVYLPINGVLQDEAVELRIPPLDTGELQPVRGTLLVAESSNRGFYHGVSLLEHRLQPGRQVFLFDEREQPIGEVFRVEYVQHSGSVFDQKFHSEVSLRPMSIAAVQNY